MTSWLSQCSEINFNTPSDFISSPNDPLSFFNSTQAVSSQKIKCHNCVSQTLEKISANSKSKELNLKTFFSRCLNTKEKQSHFGASPEGVPHEKSATIRLDSLFFGKQIPGKDPLLPTIHEKFNNCSHYKHLNSDQSQTKKVEGFNPETLIKKTPEKQQTIEKTHLTGKCLEKQNPTNNESKIAKGLEHHDPLQRLFSNHEHQALSDNEKQQKQQPEEEQFDEEELKIFSPTTKKKNNLSSPNFSFTKLPKIENTGFNETINNASSLPPEAIIPVLPLPNTGLFALYYILTKQGILSDFSAYSTYKNEMEFNQGEIDATYKQRIEQLREAVDRETTVKRWGILGKFFSWMASFLGSVAGLILIFSGVGAIMGAGLLAAGLFSLVSSLVEWTGGWNYIAKLLPGNNINKKRAVISWMKIGISIICLVLSLITCFATGGISQAMRAAQGIPQTIITILMSGFGVAIIGEAISSFRLFNSVSHVKTTERTLESLYHKREDLNERAQSDVESIETLFDNLVSALNLDREIAQIDAAFYR